jgi:hypothetical protein
VAPPVTSLSVTALARWRNTLTEDLIYLTDGSRPRGALMLEAQAQEEAAKVLILLDLVRTVL